jgi:hypothetical protein
MAPSRRPFSLWRPHLFVRVPCSCLPANAGYKVVLGRRVAVFGRIVELSIFSIPFFK